MSKSTPSFPAIRRFLLRLALGKSTYEYMCESVLHDPRTRRARSVDIITRKDGREVRVEADWVKTIARIVQPPEILPVTYIPYRTGAEAESPGLTSSIENALGDGRPNRSPE